jgi:RNA polymerase sigma factor (sigma-70 family)
MNDTMNTDEAILKSYEKFDEFVKYARMFTHNRPDAEDLVQDAFVKVIKAKDHIEPTSFEGLMVTAIYRLFCTFHHKRKRAEYRKIRPEELVLEPEREIPVEVSMALEEAVQRVPHASLLIALDDHETVPRLAAAQGLSPHAVRGRLDYARDALRQPLQRIYERWFRYSPGRRPRLPPDAIEIPYKGAQEKPEASVQLSNAC